jgi:hypothetical protein
MLKIKDNVDLKELEKFGFEYGEEDWDGNKWHFYHSGEIYIDQLNENQPEFERVLDTNGYGYSDIDGETLYDLIKADLVEKVEE